MKTRELTSGTGVPASALQKHDGADRHDPGESRAQGGCLCHAVHTAERAAPPLRLDLFLMSFLKEN